MKTSIITAVLIVCLTAASAWSQTRTKLNVIYPAISGINAPLWYATEQKLFPKYGLEVELIYIPTALQVTRVVLTGDSRSRFPAEPRSSARCLAALTSSSSAASPMCRRFT